LLRIDLEQSAKAYRFQKAMSFPARRFPIHVTAPPGLLNAKPGVRPSSDSSSAAEAKNIFPAGPTETIAPGQCDAFQQTIKRTYNFNPAHMNDAQIKDQSARLDVFWNQVRERRVTLLPCLRQTLKQDATGSFFAIDGSMLLVEIDPSTASKALQVRKFIDADLDGSSLE